MSFSLDTRLDGQLGRTGTIHTPHGDIQTPAFIPVATKATVKSVLPETMREIGAQALLSNAYHLYLQPGSDVVDAAGGVAAFENWHGPTFTDSGGFQVLSLGSGFKKVLSEEFNGKAHVDGQVATNKERLANVDDDGVWFRSHLNGSKHRFTPEVSMRIQHELGADIIFAFDELTTLLNSRGYQEEALERTRLWAERCLRAHKELTEERADKPYQQLFGVIQGAQYEDLRRKAARDLGSMEIDGQRFDGFGVGGALEKENLGTIVRWVNEELPEDRARHLLGISEPDDLFVGVENGVDTFDCVNPSRVARNAAIYSPDGRFNANRAQYKRDFSPLVEGCECYTCTHYTRAYIHHLFKAKEMVVNTLTTIHNEHFTIKLVDDIRAHMKAGTYWEFKEETLGRFYGTKNK
ncbi:tRNA guanosine(34) transglycosylase Tgt [Arcanobacterium haemolyticum]|uniref:Queuine tRNA-ribosyltransferase n=1 Tax=Arcanobacterium haemolyticum (strain ATCC 9345 / DSM 20595 / CCM 5947 / CCUG 17215 / LMG 16163 / NBRC 15585 / NCTC 8452 / 11018) TaxID=644284 RepID=D7BLD5_ARCHD|nr:tRNA guanosine(34) transglycosylase Tgt [Arcanobacterium haemolyticum]ADH93465.1 queuine tRNA-ribosyltransferase [Arcanobacterium haemolyticum DSM 20595]SQH27527.1 Queuine tRNA-ribosyltransferase [Arcanobacterium haemolyticum]